MIKSTLAEYLKTAYPHFKTESNLPVWLLPEHSFAAVADNLEDEKLLALSPPLCLTEDFTKRVEELPAPEILPNEIWHQAIKSWPSLGQVQLILGTLLEVTSYLTEKSRQGKLQAKPEAVCQALAVLGLASLVSQGNQVIRDLALNLKGDPDQPAELIRRYAEAAIGNDLAIIKQINATIAAYPLWMEWASLFAATVQELPFTPRLIGITPPLSSELISVLAQMLQEEQDVESGKDYQQHPAG